MFFNDTVTVSYTIDGVDEQRQRTTAKVEVTNQNHELVAVGRHILKWTRNADAKPELAVGSH